MLNYKFPKYLGKYIIRLKRRSCDWLPFFNAPPTPPQFVYHNGMWHMNNARSDLCTSPFRASYQKNEINSHYIENCLDLKVSTSLKMLQSKSQIRNFLTRIFSIFCIFCVPSLILLSVLCLPDSVIFSKKHFP